MPQLAFSVDFLDAMERIPAAQRKKVRNFTKKFRENPTSAAINYEKIRNVRDDRVRTVRIDQQYRAVVLHPDQGDIYVLVWVDNHDEAMAWAMNRTFEVNPATGALQVFDVGKAEQAVEHGNTTSRVSGLYSQLSDPDLLSVGVPSPLLPAVRAVKSVLDLGNLSPHLPKEAAEALYFLSDGLSLEEVKEACASTISKTIDTDNLEIALAHPDSKRRFVTVMSDEELSAILDAPLDRWRIFLHPSQNKIASKEFNGPTRVLGGPGTGKTVVAMHRARFLARRLCVKDDDRVLFTTFTANLAQDVDSNLDNLCSPSEKKQIVTLHLHAWAMQFLRSKTQKQYQIVQPDEEQHFWETAIDLAGLQEIDANFMRLEWKNVIVANNLLEENDYLRVSRVGRGKSISRQQRTRVWEAAKTYRTLLEQAGKTDWHSIVNRTRELVQELPQPPFQAVVVDEAQDFDRDEWALIRRLTAERKNDLFIVGDAQQRIYGLPVVLSQCGINIRGRSNQLRINYRTTEQIARWANTIIAGEGFDDLDGGALDTRGYRSLLSGPSPDFYQFQSTEEERAGIEKILDELLKGREPSQIAIVARTGKILKDHYVPLLKQRKIPYTVLGKDNKCVGIALATMHRVKGLEFPVVILGAINEDIIPSIPASVQADAAALKERVRSEQSLLFVAATRARDLLIIVSDGSPSRFIANACKTKLSLN